jgi:uncharacterized membrane protein
VDAAGQLNFIVHNPGRFGHVMIRNVVEPNLLYAQVSQFVGWLGHMKLTLPAWFVWVHVLVFFLVACFDVGPRQVPFSIRHRLVCFAVWLITNLLISATIYITWMHVGDERLQLQGRYFIPTSPLLCFCFYRIRGIRPALTRAAYALLPYFAVVYLPLSLAFCAWALYLHFYVNEWLP